MKKINLVLIVLFVATIAKTQVKLSLNLLPDGKTYQVSMTPETTWDTPQNTTGSAQIVVAVPVGEGFLAKNVESKILGVTWLDDTYVENPPAAPGWTFIAFTIKEMGTKSIQYVAGIETPLFTFQNAKGNCANGLVLLENDDPLVKGVVKNKFNVTQNLTVLGMRGNAFNGVIGNNVICPENTTTQPDIFVSKIKASPIPAGDYVDFTWVNAEGLTSLELQLINDKGQIIKQHKLNTKPGEQSFHAELTAKAQGIYSANFIANGEQRHTIRLAVMP